MSTPRTTPWIGGAAFGAVVVLAGSWFLGVQPRLDEAALLDEQADDIEGQNAVLQSEVDVLAAQYARIDEFRAEVAALRTHVPDELGAAEYRRQIDARAVEAGVSVTGLTVSVPQLVGTPVAPQVGAEAPTATDTTAADAGGGDGGDAAPVADTTAPAAEAPAAVDGFVLVPVELTVLGPFENVMRFLQGEQQAERIRLVHGVTLTGQEERAAAPGEPATAVGDVEAVLSTYLYVLADPADGAGSGETGAERQPVDPASIPAPGDGIAPFVPRQY